jgi:hypothetical protein
LLAKELNIGLGIFAPPVESEGNKEMVVAFFLVFGKEFEELMEEWGLFRPSLNFKPIYCNVARYMFARCAF